MGPVRRGIILALVPGSAFAEVCDKERPFWNPADGPVGLWSEPLHTFASPIGAASAVLLLIAFLANRRWLWGLTALLFAYMTVVIFANRLLEDPTGILDFAIKEGCVGPAHLSIALTAAICGLSLWRALRARKPI